MRQFLTMNLLMCTSYWFCFSSWNTWIKTQISVSRDRVQLWTTSIMVTIKIHLISVNKVLAYWLNYEGFLGGSVIKNPPANAGDMGSIPGSGRSPAEENGNPLQYSCLENSMDSGAWRTSVHGVAKSDMTECTRHCQPLKLSSSWSKRSWIYQNPTDLIKQL